MGSSQPWSSSKVLLDIGGKKYSTTVDTLTQREPHSMLAAMFSGRHTVSEDPETGVVFVDRDGKHFRHILNWLREGIIPILTESEYQELLREAEYYQLLGFVEHINIHLNRKKDGEGSGAELTRKDVIKCIQSKRVRFRGVNLSGLNLSKLDLSYVDFSYACIQKTCFRGANLQKAKFGDVEGDGSDFQDAFLRVNLSVQISQELYLIELVCKVQICKFITGGLILHNPADACLIGGSLCEADLRTAHLQNAKLSDANLKGANLEGANLKGAKLSGANLNSANLQRAYLREVDLRDTQMEGAKLGGANLLGAIR